MRIMVLSTRRKLVFETHKSFHGEKQQVRIVNFPSRTISKPSLSTLRASSWKISQTPRQTSAACLRGLVTTRALSKLVAYLQGKYRWNYALSQLWNKSIWRKVSSARICSSFLDYSQRAANFPEFNSAALKDEWRDGAKR